jgi:TolA-binding protein
MPSKKWTEEEEEFLKNDYMEMSNAELAEKFGVTKNAVQKKLARLGLKRSKPVKSVEPDEASDTDVSEEKEPEVISTESHLSLGNKLFYEDRDYEQAIEEYDKSVKAAKDEEIKLKARYWMAESHVKLGKIDEAKNIFGNIAEEHGDHYLGDSARKRLAALEEYIVPAM